MRKTYVIDRLTNRPTDHLCIGAPEYPFYYTILTNSAEKLYPCFDDGSQNHNQAHQKYDVQGQVHFSQSQEISNVNVNTYINDIMKIYEAEYIIKK